MEPNTIIQLRKNLEKLQRFSNKNFPTKFKIYGYYFSVIFGIVGIILLPLLFSKFNYFQKLLVLIGPIYSIIHSLYLLFRYHNDKRTIKLIELLLADDKIVERDDKKNKSNNEIIKIDQILN